MQKESAGMKKLHEKGTYIRVVVVARVGPKAVLRRRVGGALLSFHAAASMRRGGTPR